MKNCHMDKLATFNRIKELMAIIKTKLPKMSYEIQYVRSQVVQKVDLKNLAVFVDNRIILITNWAISNDIDLVWAVNKNTGFENIFPKLFNKSLNFASWSSNKMISETLQNGLSDPQGVDSDLDSSLYVE